MNTLFFSNSIYRQFHVDMRLVLYEFQEMPVHERVLEDHLALFGQLFKYLADETYKYL